MFLDASSWLAYSWLFGSVCSALLVARNLVVEDVDCRLIGVRGFYGVFQWRRYPVEAEILLYFSEVEKSSKS